MKNIKWPGKVKLITFGGFYQIIKQEKFVPRINYPMTNRISVVSAEFGTDYTKRLNFHLIFDFYQIKKGYAEYRQSNSIEIHNDPEWKTFGLKTFTNKK